MGKTYDEIIKLPQPIIMWHYFQALKNLEQERIQKEDEQKLMILLIRPELYEAMYKKGGDDKVFENKSFVETTVEDEYGEKITMSTMTPEEFRRIVKQQEELTKNQVVVQQTREGEIVNSGQFDDFDYPMTVIQQFQ